MSVTFWIPDGPTRKEETPCDCTGPLSECLCNGDGSVVLDVPAISLNVSNATARALLKSLGVDTEDLSGGWSLSDLPNVRRRILQLINQPESLEPFVQEGHIEDRFIDFGVSDDRLLDRLQRLMHIIVEAQRLNLGIAWG